MSVKVNDQAVDQARRSELKSQDQRLRRLAVQGAGISPWEAEILVDVVKEVYLSEPGKAPLRSGQMIRFNRKIIVARIIRSIRGATR